MPAPVNPLECALPKNAPASPLDSALTKSLDLNSPGINTYENTRGGGPPPGFLALAVFLSLSWATSAVARCNKSDFICPNHG